MTDASRDPRPAHEQDVQANNDSGDRLGVLWIEPWDTLELTGPRDVRARLCPLCSAWVWSVAKHRDWHRLTEREQIR